MAIGWIYLKYLHSRGVFRAGKAKILDVGCQNLFSIPENEGVSFLLDNRTRYRGEPLRDRVRQLSVRSTWPKGIGDTVFFSEFVALSGLQYCSYDIFPGPGVHIFDMNSDTVPPEHHAAFDCVFNFGTTEHVFNQYNSFKVIHEVTALNGHMFHQVPTVGYINHGYWIYSPRTLLELARANAYTVEAFWITGPQGSSSLAGEAAAPELSWDLALPENAEGAWAEALVPNGLINALFVKREACPFRLSLDTTTSAAAPDPVLAQSYLR